MAKIVITSIQQPTLSLVRMVETGLKHGVHTIVIGDRKTPDASWPIGSTYFPISIQNKMNSKLVSLLPENHYSRKNLGYLAAFKQGADFIFDTDDDNSPLSIWRPREINVSAKVCSHSGWVNAYKWFSDEIVWPRGLPLESLSEVLDSRLSEVQNFCAPIQQGLANGSPDVDAVWRLTQGREITFRNEDSVLLEAGAWCPFNSQSTWWFPDAYPLMYLPSFVSFRMTDIWRSFVAQRCLWAMGYGVVFHGPEMFQERNPHNLLKDFEQEVPGYLGNQKICQVLEDLDLQEGNSHVTENMFLCYEKLVSTGFVPSEEMPLVDAWVRDLALVTDSESGSLSSAP